MARREENLKWTFDRTVLDNSQAKIGPRSGIGRFWDILELLRLSGTAEKLVCDFI